MTDNQTPLNSEPNSAPPPVSDGFHGAIPPAPPAPPAPPVPPAEQAPSAQQTASAHEAPQQAPASAHVLDHETYTALRTPRGAGALALDGSWHQISPRYVVSQFVQNAIFVGILLIVALVVAFAFEQTWVWIPFGVIVAFTAVTMIILPRQARALGYMLRADDVVFRRGILWQRIIAVPYGRMQLVDITHGPLDRAFGVSQLKMVTAAATTGVQIPGLTQAAAESLRDTLIDVAETRRTGL